MTSANYDVACLRRSVQPPPPPPPSYPDTGLDRLRDDRELQGLWTDRLVAFIIDSVIVGVAVTALTLLIALPFFLTDLFTHGFRTEGLFPWTASGFLMSIVYLLYFTLVESSRGTTIGKSIMKLRVTAEDGRGITLEKAFLRNLSKLHWVLLLLDILIGLGTQGNPNQKFSDRYAGTIVVKARA